MMQSTALKGLLLAGALASLLPACSDPAPPPPPKVASEPGVIRFAPDSADLDALQLVKAQADTVPVSADLNARLGVDEAVTARIGAPVAARVTALLADIGDRVVTGPH
jgi:cobalt-zinc-cadmium efflux system membrane fusion protein